MHISSITNLIQPTGTARHQSFSCNQEECRNVSSNKYLWFDKSQRENENELFPFLKSSTKTFFWTNHSSHNFQQKCFTFLSRGAKVETTSKLHLYPNDTLKHNFKSFCTCIDQKSVSLRLNTLNSFSSLNSNICVTAVLRQ